MEKALTDPLCSSSLPKRFEDICFDVRHLQLSNCPELTDRSHGRIGRHALSDKRASPEKVNRELDLEL